ncbi:MAG: glutathione peroxidase [Marinobacter sp.]|nr:glutathione peroxidase [Marinobacter sp.]
MRLIIAAIALFMSWPALAGECPDFLSHDLRKLHSRDSVNLCELSRGKPVLAVNTASHCGFTRQFEGLEAVHQRFKDRGLVVVGFASNDFRQEARDEAEAAAVCFINFGVTFTMIAPSAVTGRDANPVFQEINRQSQAPRWNFSKYLINAEGEVVESFPSQVRPDDPRVIAAIERVLP